MAIRPIFSTTDKASTNPITVGNALSADLCTQAFPESSNKRNWHYFRPVVQFTTGATPAEAFIDGVQNFRFRVADRSTAMLKLLASYNSAVAGSNTAFELTVAVQNINGVVALVGTPLVVKYPAASTANVNVGIDAPTQALTFTCVGNAGDTNGSWEVRTTSICEVTDLGM